MIPFIARLNHLADAWARLIWAVTWQSTLLVALFAILALGMRRSSPGIRYWLWQIVAIKLLVMPLWGVSILLPGTTRSAGKAHSKEWSSARSDWGPVGVPMDGSGAIDRYALANGRTREGQERWLRFRLGPLDWQAWLLIGWGLVVAGQVAAIAYQRKQLSRLLRQAAPVDDEVLLGLVLELSGRIGLRREPAVLIGGGSPFVCGLRRPTLVLPPELTRALDPGPLRAVLLHELAHFKRRDLLWGWIPAIARLFYFFHPAVHYIVDRACLERELACDQAAMVLTGQSAAGYASTLVEVVSLSSSPPAVRAAMASAGLEGAEPCPNTDTAIEITSS